MSVFVHSQGIKTVHAGGAKIWQNSVHVVVKGIPSRMLLYRYNFSTRRRLLRIVKQIFVIQKQN